MHIRTRQRHRRPETSTLSGGQNRLRCFLSGSQRRLDRAHVSAGIQRFTRKEYGASIQFSQRRLRLPCFGSGIGISATCGRIVAPVDRLRGDKIPRNAVPICCSDGSRATYPSPAQGTIKPFSGRNQAFGKVFPSCSRQSFKHLGKFAIGRRRHEPDANNQPGYQPSLLKLREQAANTLSHHWLPMRGRSFLSV